MMNLFFNTVRVGRGLLSKRCCSQSSLFVSDRLAKGQPVLSPKPDLPEKFKDLQRLQKNLDARGIDTNAADLKELYEIFEKLSETRGILDKRRVDIVEEIKTLAKVPGNEAEIEKLKLHGRMVKTDYKNLMKAFWDVEERTMLNCLALPNDLHPRTPLQESEILKPPNSGTKTYVNHLEAGKNLIIYSSPESYYLENSAAIFDLALTYYFLEGMKSAGFKSMVAPDFVHAAVVEGCGSNPHAAIGLEPVAEKMHLVGGASLFPFCTFLTRKPVLERLLPLKFTSTGRRYELREGRGLFGAWQKTCVDFFVFSENEDTEPIFEKSVEQIQNLYEKLGWQYRVRAISAKNLKMWESQRVSFEMACLDSWVEVGSISLSGSYLSERLDMTVEAKDRSKHFGSVVSGTAVNATSALACVLEQNENLFPECLEPHSFGLF